MQNKITCANHPKELGVQNIKNIVIQWYLEKTSKNNFKIKGTLVTS